jgi:hypothetical protein
MYERSRVFSLCGTIHTLNCGGVKTLRSRLPIIYMNISLIETKKEIGIKIVPAIRQLFCSPLLAKYVQ